MVQYIAAKNANFPVDEKKLALVCSPQEDELCPDSFRYTHGAIKPHQLIVRTRVLDSKQVYRWLGSNVTSAPESISIRTSD